MEVTRRDCLNSSWFGVLDLGIYGAVRHVYERGVPGCFTGCMGAFCDSAALADK